MGCSHLLQRDCTLVEGEISDEVNGAACALDDRFGEGSLKRALDKSVRSKADVFCD